MTTPAGDDGMRHLDLTAEPADAAEAAPKLTPLEERREDARRTLAVWLLIGLAVVIAGWVVVGVLGDETDTEATDALRTAFTGLLGLTGTAVGFYFGGGTSKDS